MGESVCVYVNVRAKNQLCSAEQSKSRQALLAPLIDKSCTVNKLNTQLAEK